MTSDKFILEKIVYTTIAGPSEMWTATVIPALYGMDLKPGSRLDFKPPKGAGIKKPLHYQFRGVDPKDITLEHILKCLEHVKAGQPVEETQYE